MLTGHLRRQARAPELLVLTKANTPSTVHRGSYLDYVGVKTFDAAGNVTGEHRFLGLWTSSAYHMAPAEIPLLRRKLEAVIAHFGLPAHSHDAKSVVHVIETFPRDELFQTQRRRARRASCAASSISTSGAACGCSRGATATSVSIPASSTCRATATTPRCASASNASCATRFGGTDVESQVQISDSMLARLHMLVRTPQGARPVEDFDAIEVGDRRGRGDLGRPAAAGADRARRRARRRRPRGALCARISRRRIAPTSNPRRRSRTSRTSKRCGAVHPVPALNLRDTRSRRTADSRLHLRILQAGDPISISDILPMLENFGLRVVAEHPYHVQLTEAGVWIQDFELEARDTKRVDVAALEPLFKEAFLAAWRGDIENDGFNRLLLCAGLSAREIVVLRAYCRYLLQTGIPFSQAYMERVLVAQAPITRALVRAVRDPVRARRQGARKRGR